ncbi:MAG: MFS transporter [Candidatus Pacebacteria bacterium]|nr:MFS transporter [Candidatus Paceibacterota bacterium]
MVSATKHKMTREEKKVIFASSLGTVFEWYDFYLYGTLAAVIGKQFFTGATPAAQFIFSLLAFAAGFAVRPFGAIIFGRLGDLAGRKYTFLITIILMGASTVLIGFLPNYSTIGIMAPILLITLRLIQGLALGGEYGGAATYVGEHAPKGRRGEYTSWIQITATLGLFLAILVILACRLGLRDHSVEPAHMDDAFNSWGWRIPFLVSALLLAISVWIRLELNESPVFVKMKKENKGSKTPLKDSFTKWPNLKLVILALFGLTMGQAVIWYGGQFYALLFLTQTVRVDPITANLLVALALLLATPFFIFFGWLSDRIGRKWIILTGCLIAAVIYFPTFKALTHFANPALEQAVATSPVVIKSDPANCSSQFDPTGGVKFTSSCDTATSFLAKRGVPYTKQDGEAGSGAVVLIAGKEIPSYDQTDANAKELGAKFTADLGGALNEAQYPLTADPNAINYPMVLLLLWILVMLVAMVYGPIAALLIDMFPMKIRYTSMSLPYHIGNGWFGGFLPFIVFSIVVATGDVYSGLWYPVIIALITLVIGALFIREGKEE